MDAALGGVAALASEEPKLMSPAGQATGVSDGESRPVLTFPPAEAKIEKLPWPHQAPNLSPEEIEAINRDVWVINNNPLYQSDEAGQWCYLHGGLDIVLTNGTRIYAMKDGWVKTTAHSTVIVADAQDGLPCYGWAYAHLGRFQVKSGDFVKRGTLLGEVDFRGLSHTHLEKVFSQGGLWSSWRYVCFPDDHFTFVDDEPPTIVTPFYFFEHNSDQLIQPQTGGLVAVRGDVDIVVALRDGGRFAHSSESGFGDRLAVTRIEYTLQPARKDAAKQRFHSFDFRKLRFLSGTDLPARFRNTSLAKTLYKHWALFGKPTNGDKNLSYCIISRCPSEAAPVELESVLTNECWHTAARDAKGTSLYPDGEYLLSVTACDSHENRATETMRIKVDNSGRLPITAKELPQQGVQAVANSKPPTRSAGGKQASPEDIQQTSVEEWFRRVGHDGEAGYAPFTAMNALIARAKENTSTRDEIVRQATAIIDDGKQDMMKRWQCCYVLSGTGDRRGIAPLTRALKDQNETVRSVAACALGAYDDAEAISALKEAAGREQAPRVQEEIKKALNGAFRKR